MTLKEEFEIEVKTKNGKKMNHNKYYDFIYSAPPLNEAVSWLHGKKIEYPSSIMLKLGVSKNVV